MSLERQPAPVGATGSQSHARRSVTPYILTAGSRTLGSSFEDRAHLCHDHGRVQLQVSGRESQQPNALFQKPVLAAVVLGPAISMQPAVVFEPEPALWVVQIRPAKEMSVAVQDRHLRLGSRQ